MRRRWISEASCCRRPGGWTAYNKVYANFEIGSDPSVIRGGTHPVVIRFKGNVDRAQPDPDSNLGQHISQSFDATTYRGKRMQMRMDIKAEDVAGFVGIFMIARDINHVQIGFDDLRDRGDGHTNGLISANTDWVTRTIVMNIPEKTELIDLAFYLIGEGTAYMSNFSFEIVDASVAITSSSPRFIPKPAGLVQA